MRDSGDGFSDFAVSVNVFVALFLKVCQFFIKQLCSPARMAVCGRQSYRNLGITIYLIFDVVCKFIVAASQKNDLDDRCYESYDKNDADNDKYLQFRFDPFQRLGQ